MGIDEKVAAELVKDFPRGSEIVRIPRNNDAQFEVDFWILPFQRKDTAQTFARLQGVKVVQSMMAGVDWITPWLPKESPCAMEEASMISRHQSGY